MDNEKKDFSSIFHAVKSALQNDGLFFTIDEELEVFTVPFSNDIFEFTIDVYSDERYLVAMAIYPVKIEEKRIPQLLIEINQYNQRVPIGSFQVRPSNNQLNYRIGVPLKADSDDRQVVLDELMICNMVYMCASVTRDLPTEIANFLKDPRI